MPVLPRSITWAPDPLAYGAAVSKLAEEGAPIFDHCRGTLPVSRENLPEQWQRMITELPPGVTHIALHCTAPGDFEAMSPRHAAWRIAEYDLLLSGFLRQAFAAANIPVVGTRKMQSLWLNHLAK